MNFTGKLEGLKMDYATKKQSISVEVNEDARDAFQELKDCEKLDIQIKKHREKRSLDANAYYWVLITKFAKKLELSNPEAHNMCLIRYGYPVILSGKSAFTTIPDTEEAENKVKNSTEYHLQPTSQVREGVDGVMYRTYRLLNRIKNMAGGEAGSETVVGTQSLMNMIQDAVNNSGNRDDGAIQALLEAIYNWMRNGGLYKLMIDVLTNGVELEFDNREIARLVKKYA